MEQITLMGRPTDLGIVKSEKTGKYGVIDRECTLIVPFEYDYIDNVMSASGIIMAKKKGIKTLMELYEEV